MGKYNLQTKRETFRPVPGAGPPQPPPGLGRVLREAVPEKWTLLAGIVAMLISTGASLAIPALFGRVIDGLTRQAGVATDSATAEPFPLSTYVAALVAASLGNAAFTCLKSYLFALAGERIVAGLRTRLFDALLHQEVGFFEQSSVGELVARLGGDTTVLKEAATSNISAALRWSATALGGIAYLFSVSAKLTLCVVVLVVPLGIGTRVFSRAIKGVSKKARQALAEAAEVASEALTAIRAIRTFDGEGAQLQQFEARVQRTLRLGMRAAVSSSLFSGGTSAAIAFAFVAIVWYGGSLVLAGELSPGALTSFLMYALTIGSALSSIAAVFGSLSAAAGASERVFQLLDRLPIVPRDAGAPLPAPVRGAVELRDVVFAYPSRPEQNVLRGLSLRVPAGACCAVVGESGAGKSTILALLQRLYDPASGAVLVDGHDLRGVSGSSLRRHVGLVLQEPTLLACSVRDNILLGRPGASDAEVEAAARAANAHDFLMRFPDGYGTMVGERGQRLSGGQKQRIALARVLLQDPAVLLLDEATSALDASAEAAVQDALERVMAGRTVIIVAHRLSTVRDANPVFVLSGGRLAGRGTHAELMAGNALYAELVQRQLMAASSLADATGPPAAPSGPRGDEGGGEADAPVHSRSRSSSASRSPDAHEAPHVAVAVAAVAAAPPRGGRLQRWREVELAAREGGDDNAIGNGDDEAAGLLTR